MLFNSFEFLVFLPIVFLLYWLVFKWRQTQNVFIVVASYVFYGWWAYRFLLLIFITTLLSYLSGILIERYRDKAKWICGTNITINIGILCYYKYVNFFADNLEALINQFGYQLDWVTLDIILPVGISFYTFQALSYTIDVYRRDTNATKDFIAFTSFISFFPQLVAGPIERSTNLLPQFLQPRRFDYTNAVIGMRQILWGFFKKLIIADNCAQLANSIFDNYQECNASLLLLGALFFTFQIYGDFSGYSDIAIGTARLFGVNLMKNFNLPYFSRDIAEFWRRWHISLNKWFIDYVYIPLGGSRGTKAMVIRNILIVFFLSGLWHGANWTFVIWGLYNGIIIALLTLLNLNHKRSAIISEKRFFPPLKEFVQIFITFVLVVIGWIFFRAEDLTQAVDYIANLCNSSIVSIPNFRDLGLSFIKLTYTLFFIVLLQLIDWIQRKQDFGLEISNVKYRPIRWSIYIIFLLIFSVFAGGQEAFIYFQF